MILSPANILRLLIVTIIAFTIHSLAWITHELSASPTWPRWLELTYLISLIVWVPSLIIVLWGKARLKRRASTTVLEDERSSALVMQAHVVAVVVVLLIQLPFFFLEVPSNVLAQLTVTTCVVAIFGGYVWLDR